MAVSVASFRKDLPEFASVAAYPDAVVTYWLTIGTLLMGIGSGAPPRVCSFVGSIDENGMLTVGLIEFGTFSLLPLLLMGDHVGPSAAILSQISGLPGLAGTYQTNFAAIVPAENMVALQNGTFQGGNLFWGPASLVPTSPPTTVTDFALEMWTAHQIVIEKQAVDAAKTGGDPGTSRVGLVTSKSVNNVSISYDVSAVTTANAGYYNQTIYGMRFIQLARLRGAGPIQIGIGVAPLPFMGWSGGGIYGSGNAWAGPYPGIAPSDTGFGS